MAIACDVSEYDNCAAAVAATRKAFGPIDVLVNNAALTYFMPVAQFDKKWLRSTAVNFHGPFYMSQLALEDMLPRRSGAIVNISSASAIGPGRYPYDELQRGRGVSLGARGERADPKHRHEIVNFRSASKDRQPFEATIRAKKMLPNVAMRFCTTQLKVNPVAWWVRRDLKWSHHQNVLGIRHRRARALRFRSGARCPPTFRP